MTSVHLVPLGKKFVFSLPLVFHQELKAETKQRGPKKKQLKNLKFYIIDVFLKDCV